MKVPAALSNVAFALSTQVLLDNDVEGFWLSGAILSQVGAQTISSACEAVVGCITQQRTRGSELLPLDPGVRCFHFLGRDDSAG